MKMGNIIEQEDLPGPFKRIGTFNMPGLPKFWDMFRSPIFQAMWNNLGHQMLMGC